MVKLGDGTFGLLPEEWLERFAPLARLGTKEEDHLRFRRNQAVLDALLAAQLKSTWTRYSSACASSCGPSGCENGGAAPGFVGQLRVTSVKASGGWSSSGSSAGGCLADDMRGRQDGAGAGHFGGAAHATARPVTGGGAEIVDVQLARGIGAFTRNCACWSTPAWRAIRR